MARETSTRRLPTFMAAIPAHIDSSVTRESSISSGAWPVPTNAVNAASPCQPSTIAPAVDGDDVAVLQDGLVVRDAMHDDLVGRGADRRGETAVPEEVRLGAVLREHLAGDLVQVPRGRTGHRRFPRGRMDRRDDQPRLTHLGDLLGGLDLHHGGCGLSGPGLRTAPTIRGTGPTPPGILDHASRGALAPLPSYVGRGTR